MSEKQESTSPETWQDWVVNSIKDSGYINLGNAIVEAVKSDTDPMEFYYVIYLREGRTVCTCKGFRFRDHCKHILSSVPS